uniref:Small ubiquitin-related modifier n=1 Tax=Noccaea caerulescens TaxID=107243 RepID=A0A1J3E3M3_NOCCA
MVSSVTTISASYESKRSRSPEPTKKKINVKVKNQQDGGSDVYKVGVNAPLKKLMTIYCEKKNLDYRTVRFIFDGKELKPRNTPAQLMMEDDDIIDMVTEQGGG